MSAGYSGFSVVLEREHLDVNVRKDYNLLWAFRRVCRARWGLRLKLVQWLYVGIVRPAISFASVVWWPGCQTASAKKKLSKVQRLAFLGIMGAIHTISTGAK